MSERVTLERPLAGHQGRRASRGRIILYGSGLVAVVAVVVGALIAGRTVARNDAFRDAGRMTSELAVQVGPLLAGGGNADAVRFAELNRTIDIRKSDGFLKKVNIWDVTGRVIDADDASQIGRLLEPPPEAVLAIADGAVSSEFEAEPEASDLSFDGSGPGFVEVYVPLDRPDQPRLAFEAYYDFPRADAAADQLFGQFLPLVLLLLVLMIIQLPVAALIRRARLRRDLRRTGPEPPRENSGKDRIRVAADLHDGPIQDIAGVGYALGAVALSVPEQGQPLMHQAQESLQRALGSLRRMMVDVYPMDLTTDGLPGAIANLAVPLGQHGVNVRTNFEPLPPLTDDIVSTLYRSAHEGLANVAEHAHASRLDIDLWSHRDPPGGPSRVRLQLTDDGIGFDPIRSQAYGDGHHGLRQLENRLNALGGSLTLTTGPRRGTTLRIELPVGGGQPV